MAFLLLFDDMSDLGKGFFLRRRDETAGINDHNVGVVGITRQNKPCLADPG
jgi:hypothetical protein